MWFPTRVPSGLRVSSKLESSLVEITGSMPTRDFCKSLLPFLPTAKAFEQFIISLSLEKTSVIKYCRAVIIKVVS